MKILIVEDDFLIADFILKALQEAAFEHVTIASNVEKARKALQNLRPDLILMDINLSGQLDGIMLATEKNTEAKIIFLTGSTDQKTIEKATALKPESYLTKPFKKQDIVNAVHLFQNKQNETMITIQNGNETVNIRQENILFVKSENVYIDIHTVQKVLTVRITLEKFYQLLDAQLFCRPHRSYIVKKSMVTKITRTHLWIDQASIPISRNFVWVP